MRHLRIVAAALSLAAISAGLGPVHAALNNNALNNNGLTINALNNNGLTINSLTQNGRDATGSQLNELNGVAVEAVLLPAR